MFKITFFIIFCLISSNCFSQDYFINTDGTAADTPAMYPNGGGDFIKRFNFSFRIPQSVVKSLYQGIFGIRFTVDADGMTILDSINFDEMKFHRKILTQRQKMQAMDDLIKEVNRIFDRLPEWIPATSKGVAVPNRFKWSYHIYFEESFKL